MGAHSRDEAVERFRLALSLFAAGEAIVRQNAKRRSPGASEAEIEEQVMAWLAERPGAEFGDGVGVPVTWPRTRR